VVRDLLCHFQLAAVFQIGGDTGGPEAMIANPGFDPSRFRATADDAVSILLMQGIACKLSGLTAGSAEKVALNVITDASRFDIVVQILIQTMMTGDVVLLAAFFVLADPSATPLDKIVANPHLNDGADPGQAVDHDADESAVAQPKQIRLIGRLWIIGRFFGNGDTLEQRMGLFCRQHRRFAFLERVSWTANRMGRISFDNMSGHQPVEQHAERGQVLFYGGRR
jgi:hypothetical protein